MATLEATAQPDLARVRLVLTWDEVRAADIQRVDPVGLPVTVRGAGPVPVAGAVVVFDHEAPLDTPVRYTATSDQAPDITVAAGPLVLPSLRASWLKHPGRPALNLQLPVVEQMEEQEFPADLGAFDVIGRARPVVVTAIRKDVRTTLRFATLTLAEAAAARDLLADGTVLLLQTPSEHGWGSRYVAVGDVTVARVAPTLAGEPARRWVLPLTVVDPPGGLTTGAAGATWADADTAYTGWGELNAGEANWLDLAIRAGPAAGRTVR